MTPDHLLGQHIAGHAARGAAFDAAELQRLVRLLCHVRHDARACVQLVEQIATTLDALRAMAEEQGPRS